MIPSVDDRLDSVMRGLKDVVIPALPANESLALEQAHLIFGHISLLRDQVDLMLAVERAEADELRALGHLLVEAADGGARTLSTAATLRGLLEESAGRFSPRVVRQSIADISHGIEALIAAGGVDGSDAFVATSDAAVLDAGLYAAERDRSWFSATGFERADVDLRPIARFIGDAATRK